MCLNKFCQRLSQLVRRTFYFLSTLVERFAFWGRSDGDGQEGQTDRRGRESVGQSVRLVATLTRRGLAHLLHGDSMRCWPILLTTRSCLSFSFGFFLPSPSLPLFPLCVVLMQQISVGLKLCVCVCVCRGSRFSCPFTHFLPLCCFFFSFFFFSLFSGLLKCN